MAPDHEPPLEHVYPVEYLLGLLSGVGLGRSVLSTAMRNFGWREPTPIRSPPRTQPNLTVKPDVQGKHIVGHKNYIQGRSILTANAQALVNRFAGKGAQRGSTPVGEHGSIEAFDTIDEIIGIWKNKTGDKIAETTRGTIRYAKGGVHVVPAQPR